MKEKSIVIIGAGIAGLAAGCYARMNGYQVRVFERHDKPGGLCTSWRRGDYLFDGCIHWLAGSSPGSGFHRIWRELGALTGVKIINHDIFTSFEDENGRVLNFFTNADRLGAHFNELSPPDRKLTEELVAAIKKLSQINFDVGKRNIFQSLGLGLSVLAAAPIFTRYGGMSLEELAARFRDPLLSEAVRSVFGYPDFPAIAFVMTMAFLHAKNAGFPEGGSFTLSRAIEKRLGELGGTVHYRSGVSKILTEGNLARGVELADGSRHAADIVISAADGHATIFEMLDGRFVSPEVAGYYRDLPIFKPIIQVSLGVRIDLASAPHSVRFMLKEPLLVAGEERRLLGYTHYSFDPSFAPVGKSVIVCLLNSDFGYWEKIKSESDDAYRAEKEKVGSAVVGALEKRFKGLRGLVEASDVATPLTFHRYTGNWQGSMEGFRVTKKTIGLMMSGLKMTLPGLKNFYMIGQWVKPGGGLPPAAQSGREAVEAVCRADWKRFRTTISG